MMLWLVFGGLLVLAAVFVLWPLRNTRDAEGVSQDALNVALHKERLQQLQRDREANRLTQEEFQQAEAEIHRALLHDVGDEGQLDSRPFPYWVAGAWGLVLAVVSVSLYQVWGDAEGVRQAAQVAVQDKVRLQLNEAARQGRMDEVLVQLDGQARQEQDNWGLWSALGRSYMSLGRYAEALEAYAFARAHPDADLAVLLGYAEALLFANDGQGTPRFFAAIDEVQRQQPGQVMALHLLAFAAMNRDEPDQAIAYWQQALAQLPPDSENARTIRTTIARVQAQRAQGSVEPAPVEAPAAAAPSVATGPRVVDVIVDLDPELVTQLPASATLFVFAKAKSGVRVPLAVARLGVSTWPVSVRLDESMAMAPMFTLASFDEVVINARISLQGTAIAQSGDLQGLSDEVFLPTLDRPVSVVIDSRVP